MRRGMVVATTFASNVARVKTLAEAGQAAGRSVVLLGRAMRRMVGEGVETGVLTDFPPTVPPEDATQIPRENLMLIVTGSQGERRAASAQLARGKYLGPDDEGGRSVPVLVQDHPRQRTRRDPDRQCVLGKRRERGR